MSILHNTEDNSMYLHRIVSFIYLWKTINILKI